MGKWKIWAGLFVLFLSGVLIGSVGTRMYVSHKISGVLARDRPVIRDLFMRRLTRQLDLTTEQREEIERIAARVAEEFHTLHGEHRREAEAILDQAVSDMKEHLSLRQQERFDELREKWKARRWRRWRHPPPRGHPPPPGMMEHRPPMQPHEPSPPERD